MAIRVFVADDDSLFRFLLRETLPDGDIVVVGEADDRATLVAGVGDAQPDVVLLDQLCDAATVFELRDAVPAVRVIVLSGHQPDDGDRALAEAADAYIVKGANLEELREAVRCA